MESSNEEMTPQRIVVIGNVGLVGGKLGWAIYPIPEGTAPKDVDIREVWSFTAEVRKRLPGQPGSVYEIPGKPDGSKMRFSEAKYIGLYPDEAFRVAWALRSRAVEANFNAHKELKKQGKHDSLLTSLDHARRAYQGSVGMHRPQMLAIIVEYITAR